MGQHKHNQTAILAKEGKLPPKEKRMTRTEARRNVNEYIFRALRGNSKTSKMFTLIRLLSGD
jgi:hypothetical protein